MNKDKFQMINVAVIGCGYWGKNLIRNFAELNALVAVCDTNQENAKKLSETYQVSFLTLEQILQDKNIDDIIIAAPASHKSLPSGSRAL